MAGLYAPLPTLRRRPRGRLRTDRGRRGLLLLHRSGLSPHTPCQSPGALTHVAACTLARSPYVVTAIRRLQTFRLLHACSGRFRLERSPGGACTHWKSAALSRRTWDAELHRLAGTVLLAENRLNEGEASLQQAIRIAQAQQAKSLELRAARDLARLWGEQGRRTEARDLVAPVYSWFTEGFDTADLREAKALLDQLA